MLIGSKSTDTILDVFKIGFTEFTIESGLPEELSFISRLCKMTARGPDLAKRVDFLQINFKIKDGVNPQQVADAGAKLPFAVRLDTDNGSCVLTLPPFEWHHLPQLTPIDALVEQFVPRTLRSDSWEVKVVSFVDQGLNVNRMIEEMQTKDASDLHLRAGSPPFIRVDNYLEAMDMPVITAADMEQFALQLGSQEVLDLLASERETSWQFHAAGVGYLRVSGYYKAGAIALAIRMIPERPVPFKDLHIPDVVRQIADSQRGLFLVCGVTGSGKSTTLASMVQYINESRHTHIITVEDPVEFVYRDAKSLISQRQVGRDTYSYANALRGALREDPDVILVGEMRDMDTIRAAVSAAETGHLVFSTLHTMTTVDTVNRVISYFPQAERDLIRQELAYSLRGIVCQRLLRRKGGGRIPCIEILLGGKPIVRDAILEGELDKLHGIIEVDGDMQTFDQHAVEMYQNGIIEKSEAVSACSNEAAFERIISGIKSSEGRRLLK
ncbi:MAG: PilT/PilU family type 4a pilus ATPase [Nitrospiraceae bacterium]|nr:PilT/PilU family type 4a pilus ATPase [Nitrospiraceae bacterium]